MKLLDLLVKELPKRGGWPEGMNYCGQSAFDNELYFYRHPYTGQPCDKRGIFTDSHRFEYAYTLISREQYEAALASSEGWIDWHGGDCPVDSDAIVEVKYRKPSSLHFNNDRAGDFAWSHTGSCGDIIAYRLHDQNINNRTNDDRLEHDLNECIGQDVDPTWNGEGLPPVGTICQAKVPRSITGWEWRRVKVVESGIPGAEKEVLVYDLETTLPAWTDEFRPPRTESEMAREKLAASLHIAAGASPIELNGIGALYFKLADAIISGSVFGTTFKAGK